MERIIERWRQIMAASDKAWVLFRRNTCVILPQPGEDIAAQATALLQEWGPVQVATPSADFYVTAPAGLPGWLVHCHHPDIVTYVGPEDGVGSTAGEVVVGLLGRVKRDQDARELAIIHVEKRGHSAPACQCLESPLSELLTYRQLGIDSRLAEAAIFFCPRCGRYWLRYFYEVEAFSHSGRWYLGLLSPAVLATLGLVNAKETLEELGWYFYGGSYYGGQWGRTSGKILLNP